MLNKVLLIGNVGRDPEVRYLEGNQTAGATKVASFTLATTERYRDRNGELRENTEWHNIVAWRNSAELAEKYIRRGSKIFIEGKLRTRSWTDAQGVKKFTTEVVVDNIQLLDKRQDGPQDVAPAPSYQGSVPAGFQPQAAQRPAPVQTATQAAPVAVEPEPVNIQVEDDLPF